MDDKLRNPYDLAALTLSDEEVQRLNDAIAAEAKRKGKRSKAPAPDKGRVVVVPFSWRRRLKKPRYRATWTVALHLLHLDWKAGGRPFKVTNPGLAEWGIDRWMKQDVLDELEAVGVIKKKGQPGKTTIVTVLVR
jgi:hypothetical protein